MNVSIRNYKSIRALDFESRRVNVIIGEPNCGKTNVIEALGLLGLERWADGELLFRCETPAGLFNDLDVSRPLSVEFGGWISSLSRDEEFESGYDFVFHHPDAGPTFVKNQWIEPEELWSSGDVKRYKFTEMNLFPSQEIEALASPFGQNLATLLGSHRDFRMAAAAIFSTLDFKVEVRLAEKRVSISKELDGVIISYPFTASSETLRRILFYRLAVETNRECVLLFDEPEANTFPMFTKLFAEQIAADDRGNTFFLTTHSPYLLGSLIEKTSQEELAVVLCQMENFETKARVLSQAEVQGLLDLGADAFFNLDRLCVE